MMDRKFFTAAALACIFALAGCSFNPFTTDNKLTGSPQWTAIGGALGATMMSMLNAPKGWIIGGGVGGAAIGYYTTTLRFKSGGVIQAGGVVYTVGQFATVEIPTDRLFDTNSAEFLPDARFILNSAVEVLNRFPNNNILISGNTSGFGHPCWERKLSEDRARQVAAYLWANGINNFRERSIVASRKLTYVGYGNYFPIANNIRNEGIRANSRIQITSYPSQADLHFTGRERAFVNIGDIDAPEIQSSRPY